MKKKEYIMPKAKVVKIDTASIICQSPYTEDLPIGSPGDGEPEKDEDGYIITGAKGQYIFDIFE